MKDSFAARLAGERGFGILAALPYPNLLRLGIATRTRFVDELLLEALGQYPIKIILSVGCGLDSRPWRLEFPPDVGWIETDFADVLDLQGSFDVG